MRKRTVDKHIWFSRAEAQDLQKKAKKACLSEAALIRLLLRGYSPREKPDDRFYDAMRELSAIGNNIHQLSAKANALNFIDAPMIEREAERWHKFQADIERKFLRPEESDMKWQ
ncbi:MAG: plasmid mobilization relaxosome protein MobC [Lachnospiraceae bacterium]|nr:plasmid mobilization relaxosome protein MobC [Lachnospiraceae bacterium]